MPLNDVHALRQFAPTIPVELTLLDYYGRELEMKAHENDRAGLQATRTDIETTWHTLRPLIEKHRGSAAAARYACAAVFAGTFVEGETVLVLAGLLAQHMLRMRPQKCAARKLKCSPAKGVHDARKQMPS